MKTLMTDLGYQFSGLKENFNEIIKRFPKVENEINGLKLDLVCKSSRDETDIFKSVLGNIV